MSLSLRLSPPPTLSLYHISVCIYIICVHICCIYIHIIYIHQRCLAYLESLGVSSEEAVENNERLVDLKTGGFAFKVRHARVRGFGISSSM